MQIKEIIHINDFEKVNCVFHYTSPEGLYSILKNGTFRLMDCQFFNDKSEYVYVKRSLIKAIENVSPKLKNANLIERIGLADMLANLIEKYASGLDIENLSDITG